MLALKALHIAFVISWFAGLFYLPRIYVNLAMLEPHETAVRQRLLIMARKLYRFMTPLGVLAVLCGMLLWKQYDFSGGWLHLKTSLVLLLILYHLWCGRLLRAYSEGRTPHTHVWFRVFNEAPVLVMFAVVFLVVFKPF